MLLQTQAGDDSPPRLIGERRAQKRPHEGPHASRNSPEAGDSPTDKKAKAAGGGRHGSGVKQERESEPTGPTESMPHVPEPMADGVDGLMSLVLPRHQTPPRSSPPAQVRPPREILHSPPLPALEPLPPAPQVQARSSSSSSALNAAPRPSGTGKLPEALTKARDLASYASVPPEARPQELAARLQVFAAAAKAMASDERALAFRNLSQRLQVPHPIPSEPGAAIDLLTREGQALLAYMTAQQRQDALLAAKAPLDRQATGTDAESVRRRLQLICLYAAMDPAARAEELAEAQREADLRDLEESQVQAATSLKAVQYMALAYLDGPEIRRARLADLRQPGRLVHMEGQALARAMRLQSALVLATLRYVDIPGLHAERARSVEMTQALQDMGETAWQRTIELRLAELKLIASLMPAGTHLPALRQALDPDGLATLRGPSLERGLALRQLLVRQLFTHLSPAGRDRALAEAQDPQSLLAFTSSAALETAIQLRKLVFEEYFRSAPRTDGSASSARQEMASALDASGLAGQPDALVARAALLRLALVDVARQHAVAPPTVQPLPSSGYARVHYSPPLVVGPALTTQAVTSTTSSPPAQPMTTTGLGSPVLHTATGPVYFNGLAPSSSSRRLVWPTGDLPRK